MDIITFSLAGSARAASAAQVVLVYAMETDDIDRARAVGAASTNPIDLRHHEVMRAADGGPVTSKILLSLAAGE